MSHYLVWIDHEHSKVFRFTSQGKDEHVIKNHHHNTKHPSHADQAKKNDNQKFYHQVAEQVKDAVELLIVGPGMAHKEFKTHLDQHHHSDLAKKVIGVEAMDKATDGQILNMAKKYYHKYHAFN
jgi:stalled ribosome rescue protein Dom34